MPALAPPAGTSLPQGWTYHVLSGRPFYYHAATNTTRQDMPSAGGSFEMAPNGMPTYPQAMAPQLPLPQHQEQAQPQVEPEPPMPHAVAQAMFVQPAVTLAVPQPASFSMATPPASPREIQQAQQMAPMIAPQPQEERRIDPTLGGRTVTFAEFIHAHEGQGMDDTQLAGIWAQFHPVKEAHPQPPAAQALQPQAISFAPRPSQPMPVVAQPVTPTPNLQQMAQLQVLVPEPGLRAGQQLAFTAPPAGPGMPPIPMTVTVNQEVMPGSIVTVQYPRPVPQAPQVQAVGQHSRLPQPAVEVNPEEDRRQSGLLWMLYGGGWCCLLCFPPITAVLWLVAIGSYFCKPAPMRAQYRQTRVPAWTVAITCLTCTILALVMIPVAAFAGEMTGPHSHQAWHFGPQNHKGPHHHGPCPLKNWFRGRFAPPAHEGHAHEGNHFLESTISEKHFREVPDNKRTLDNQFEKEGGFNKAVEEVIAMQKFAKEAETNKKIDGLNKRYEKMVVI